MARPSSPLISRTKALAIGSAIVVQRRMMGDEPNPAWMALDASLQGDDVSTFADTCRALIKGVLADEGVRPRSGARKRGGITQD